MADGAEAHEDVLKSIIGQKTAKAKVVVERGPVQHFADAVLSTSPIYHNPEAAKADSASKAGGRQRVQADGGGTMSITINGRGGGPGGASGPIGFTLPPLQFVPISDMPDYRPAFRQGAARGDADGNLWIRTSKMVNGGTVYDVINNKGVLTDRVLLPPGRVIAGFGPGGEVYMGVLDGPITRLERARVR